ncbi:MAG: UDP-N-acetylmuramate--L-alanine ligase [Elusimicrobia bacterium GWA2_61_42]|nr:MAG: UDP-N-acetylmuramate--L-alanine ligase [Elusimicrobia bacterium GWA2_61_42]OGR78053.1 MAG: UDP-N-acetylmuramate--L-alanine ligase [Elusimicrobia bacterium GWC2_61_25]
MNYAEDFSLSDVKKARFIGIGGIGMSGIARLMLGLGYKVSGSDARESEITKALSREGAEISRGHSSASLGSPDIVVVSSAIKADNPELREAFRRGLPVVQRALMLSKLAELKKTVTVAGTHGKTTTTSMAAAALEGAGADATAVVGGIVKGAGTNLRLGRSEYLVAEADESDGSFLYFSPLVACVTNIDSDHLDHYGNMANLREAFRRHLAKLPFYGQAVLCSDDAGVREILPGLKVPHVTCGLGAGADWRAKDPVFSKAGASYTAWFRGKKRGAVRLRCGGAHNVRNSLLALAAGSYLGFEFEKLAKGLWNFSGVKRRMDRLGSAGGVDFVDDYGHHPTEVRATLDAARGLFAGRRLVVLFQPHRYSRTALLYKEFGKAFGGAARIFVAPVYAAGEKPLPGVDASLILRQLKKNGAPASAFPGPLEALKELRPGDVFLTLGAGDVWKLGEEIRLKMEMFG